MKISLILSLGEREKNVIMMDQMVLSKLRKDLSLSNKHNTQLSRNCNQISLKYSYI